MSIPPLPRTQIDKRDDDFSSTMIPSLDLRPASYRCDICHKTFQHSNMLQDHMILHAAEKPHTCSTCNRNFKCKNDCNKHMKIHTGEKSYICIVFHKTFTTIYKLEYHTTVHTGEKPYTCITCNKSFKYKNNYYSHRNIHTEKIVCKTCKKCFPTNLKLKKHSRIHLNHKTTVSVVDNNRSQTAGVHNLKKTHKNTDDVSCTKSENILSRSENIRDSFQNCNETLLSSGYVNKSMNIESYKEYKPQANYSLSSSMYSATIPSLNDLPYSMEARPKKGSKDEDLDKYATGVDWCDSSETRNEFMLQMKPHLQITNFSIDVNDQCQTSHNASLNSSSSQMFNTRQISEWDQRFQNESSKFYHPTISNNIIDTMCSSDSFSKSAYDLRIASPSSILMNRHQDCDINHSAVSFPVADTFTTNSFEIPQEDFNLNNVTHHHSTSSSQIEVSQITTPLSEQFFHSSCSLDNHVSQNQQLSAEQLLFEKNINLYEELKLFPDDR